MAMPFSVVEGGNDHVGERKKNLFNCWANGRM